MKTDRHLGNCQLCERDHKVTDGNLMVHHGYQRPGDGYIVGDCYGVGALPYELSCELIKQQRVLQVERLAQITETLRALKAGEVSTLGVKKSRFIGGKFVEEVQTLVKGVCSSYAWETELYAAIRRAERKVELTEDAIRHLTARIDAWKLSAIRVISEESIKALAKAEREARAAALQAKRDAVAAKKATLEAAREARMASQTDLILTIRVLFNVLAAERAAGTVTPEETAAKVQILLAELAKKKTTRFGSFWIQDIQADWAMIALGVATRTEHIMFPVAYNFQIG